MQPSPTLKAINKILRKLKEHNVSANQEQIVVSKKTIGKQKKNNSWKLNLR